MGQNERQPFRGWLIVYVVGLALLMVHGLELTVASVIVYTHPSLGGLATSFPLPKLLFYVITNVMLILYTIILFILMAKRRRSAIAHNELFNILSVVFLLSWFVLGMKSVVGTFVDAVPSILLLAYILASSQVRRTFTASA